MIRFRNRTAYAAVLTLALASAIAGCSDDETGTAPGVDPAVVGTWNATSFEVGGTDLIPPLGVSFVFNANGTYALNFTGDLGDFCDPGEGGNCGETGTYTSTSTTITLDPGDEDETTLSYSISGSTMTINALIDDETIVVVLNKA
jgi:hypothetical protein